MKWAASVIKPTSRSSAEGSARQTFSAPRANAMVDRFAVSRSGYEAQRIADTLFHPAAYSDAQAGRESRHISSSRVKLNSNSPGFKPPAAIPRQCRISSTCRRGSFAEAGVHRTPPLIKLRNSVTHGNAWRIVLLRPLLAPRSVREG